MTDAWLDELRPLDRGSGAPAATVAHAYLRACILDGTLPPRAVVNQVDISERLGISRTPVREAVRRLQDEGLVEAEPWKRARVVGFDPSHLEAVYVQRILLETLGLALTVPTLTADQVVELEAVAQELTRTAKHAVDEAWEMRHSHFHRLLIAGASEHLQHVMRATMERAERFRALYHYRGPAPGLQHHGVHEQIAAYCASGLADEAAQELAAHLARTALTLIGEMSPRYDPVGIRLSLERLHSTPLPAPVADKPV